MSWEIVVSSQTHAYCGLFLLKIKDVCYWDANDEALIQEKKVDPGEWKIRFCFWKGPRIGMKKRQHERRWMKRVDCKNEFRFVCPKVQRISIKLKAESVFVIFVSNKTWSSGLGSSKWFFLGHIAPKTQSKMRWKNLQERDGRKHFCELFSPQKK